jgi:hypothetical protein
MATFITPSILSRNKRAEIERFVRDLKLAGTDAE